MSIIYMPVTFQVARGWSISFTIVVSIFFFIIPILPQDNISKLADEAGAALIPYFADCVTVLSNSVHDVCLAGARSAGVTDGLKAEFRGPSNLKQDESGFHLNLFRFATCPNSWSDLC